VPLERLTDRARRALVLAEDAARASGCRYIGSGHLLYGLLGEGEGVAWQVLTALGADTERVWRALDNGWGRGSPWLRFSWRMRRALDNGWGRGWAADEPHVALPFTHRTQRALEEAYCESTRLGDPYIATEHLLLGLLPEGDGRAVLTRIGISPDAVRTEVLDTLRRYKEAENRA
jgi:ATP-dependent Clp protease ATP-binding subunit ClpC